MQTTLNNFTLSCCFPIIFRHFLNCLYHYTICKLTISFPSFCNHVDLNNSFLLHWKVPGLKIHTRMLSKGMHLEDYHLMHFCQRPNSEVYNPTNEDRYAVNTVGISRENKKYLVLREISGGGVTKLLANTESLASCDIAIFVHDRSDESSWCASSELLLKIAGHGKDTGFQVPCLIVAAKDD